MNEPEHNLDETAENPDKIVRVLREDYTEAAPPIAEVIAEEEPKVGREGYRSLPRWVYQAIMVVSIVAMLFVVMVVVVDAVWSGGGGQTAVTNDLGTPYPTPVDEIFTAPEPTDWPTPAAPEVDTVPAAEWETAPEPTNIPDPSSPTPLPLP